MFLQLHLKHCSEAACSQQYIRGCPRILGRYMKAENTEVVHC